jgi:hypothetical protein
MLCRLIEEKHMRQMRRKMAAIVSISMIVDEKYVKLITLLSL